MTTANSTPAAPFALLLRGPRCGADESSHHACDCMLQRERDWREVLNTVVTVCARVPEGEPLEPGQVSFLLEKATEALNA